VIFDYGGVLYDEGVTDFDVVGVPHGLPPGALWAAYHDLPEYGPSRRGELDREAYLRGVEREVARWIGRARAKALIEAFERERTDLDPVAAPMDALLDRLRGRVLLGILSNAGRGGREALEARGVAARFHDVVCSGDVGLAKPDSAIFRLAAGRLGLVPEQCAFVDDQERHVAGARAAGMRAHHHHRSRMPALVRFLVDVGALPRGE